MNHRETSYGVRGLSAVVLATLCFGCAKESSQSHDGRPGELEVTVLRVESPSPEQPGAEHCEREGKSCRPLAAQQRLKPQGLVRTFAGGRVSLDFGGGRRVDLDGLSQVELGKGHATLESGEFSVQSTPLIEKENIPPLSFTAKNKKFTSERGTPTSTAVSVGPVSSTFTVRHGQLRGVPVNVGAVGQTFRLASSQVFRTNQNGQELRSLSAVAPATSEFGPLLSPTKDSPRGFGTMTGRLPNTDEVRDGVQLKNHLVRVVIRDGFARTEIEEEFENTSPHILEGRYRFPVPGDASLSRLALWVGDDLVEGEVLERKRAARIYSSIVDRPVPRDPALLEWVTGGEMSLKVFPILPKKTRRVVLAYNQALSTEGGVVRYTYPLSLGQGRETSIENLSISVHASDTRGELKNLRIAGYDAKIGREGPWHTAQLRAENIAPQRDFVLQFDRVADDSAQLSLHVPGWGAPKDEMLGLLRSSAFGTKNDAGVSSPSRKSASAKGHFALRLTANLPEGFERPSSTETDRAIVLDVSQSQSKETLRAEAALAYGIVREMNDSERVVLLACDSACSVFSPSGGGNSLSARLKATRDWLLALRPGGSSDITGALVAATQQLALLTPQSKDRLRQLIYIGDGKASSGDLSTDAIAKRSKPVLDHAGVDVRFFAAGRTVDEDQLQGLARKLGATLDRLTSVGSLEQRILDLSIALRKPVLTNARLVLPLGLSSTDVDALPALLLGQELVVTGKIQDFRKGVASLTGIMNGSPYRLEMPLKIQESSEKQNPLVSRLWARAEIRRLQTEPRTPATTNAIINLSKQHRTMSRYTSFLVLENERMYKNFGVKRTTKSEEDQVDASFSIRDNFDDLEEPRESRLSELSSIETLEAPVDRHPYPPRSKKAKARPKSMSPIDRIGSLGNASGGVGRASSFDLDGAASEEEPLPSPVSKPTSPPDAFQESGRRSRPPGVLNSPFESRSRISRRRAFLTHQEADDAWRKWGNGNLQILTEKLKRNSDSRQVHEEFIRGHLQAGRFKKAYDAAMKFSHLDPDYPQARELLAYAAVVAGDHELARQMLDVRVETEPRGLQAHAQAARAFAAVGDAVRSCAHYRSLAELAPKMREANERASTCWAEMLSVNVAKSGFSKPNGTPGQFQIEIECHPGTSPEDCPSPVVVAPDGRVLSPWTPGVGRSTRQKITFVKLRTGSYYIMVLGGSPRAKGEIHLSGPMKKKTLTFNGGGMHTVARTDVKFGVAPIVY